LFLFVEALTAGSVPARPICADIVVAEAFARDAHAEQRYGNRPFADHLAHVHSVLRQFGFDDRRPADRAVFVTAWLHDVLEDTTVSRDAIAARFGEAIARSVEILTLDPSLPRREALLTCLGRMRRDEVALVVKLADRIANVEVCRSAFLEGGEAACYRDYLKEWRFLRRPFRRLARSARARRLWRHLDALLRE
jgi:(p)ppGpp synthase/HD superfamily hydrolase